MSAVAAALERALGDGSPGAQVVASLRGDPVLDLAVGEASPGVAMAPETLVPWLSSTKPVTATSVLLLWQRGTLGLDEPAGDDGTVRQILTHTVGGRVAYVPRGFDVLGGLVERLDGRSFDAFVSEEIFEPFDMPDSWLSLTPDRISSYGDRVAHVRTSAGWNAPRASTRVSPSGSGVGPMRDLVRFYEALLDGGRGVLSPQTVEAMTARHRAGQRDETFDQIIDWGLGVMVNSWHYRQRPTSYGYGDDASYRAFGHGGQQSSLAFADPAHGLAVAIAFNSQPGEPVNHRRTQRVVNAVYKDLGLA